ncbi:hypothetical protein PG993_013310 [Apiospora rasikravindrae]|uniref:Uncharacterized protein n=1 Tax=Apiospora rasikravindrae TaxID=990691 RepID=A0ABR1RXG1_9PEZI
MPGSKSATLAKKVKPDHNTKPSRGLPKAKKESDVIDLISDSEDDSSPPPLMTAMKKRLISNISGSREANPRPIKKAVPAHRDTTEPNIVVKSSSMPTGNTTHGGMNHASRLEIAQKQTQLANSKVANLEASLKDVNAELLATKNTLSHRDAEVKSYQQMEAQLMRTKAMLSKKEAELDGVTQEKAGLLKHVEQVTTENKKLSEELADSVRDAKAHVNGKIRHRLAAAEAKQLETEALLLEYRDKAPKMAKLREELEASRKAAAASDALYTSHKDEFDRAREEHRDLKNERDAAIALADSHKQHIESLKKSLAVANKSLEQARADDSAHIARIKQLEGEIHDLETVRDGLESTNEEIMTELSDTEAGMKVANERVKVAEERVKIAKKRKEEEIADLLNEIAAVKIEIILLTDRKEELDTYHKQAVSKAALDIESLKRELLDSEKTVDELNERISNCNICIPNIAHRICRIHTGSKRWPVARTALSTLKSRMRRDGWDGTAGSGLASVPRPEDDVAPPRQSTIPKGPWLYRLEWTGTTITHPST